MDAGCRWSGVGKYELGEGVVVCDRLNPVQAFRTAGILSRHWRERILPPFLRAGRPQDSPALAGRRYAAGAFAPKI